MTLDPRRYAPATARNRDVILDVLKDILPDAGTVLEIASGSGEHVAYFARFFPDLAFQPSDRTVELLSSIAAHAGDAGLENIKQPVYLDATVHPWEVGAVDAAYNCNMIHISPWAVAQGLMRGLGDVLVSGAPFLLYGPFRIDGAHTAPSNVAFDESLKAMDPTYGVRDLEVVIELADGNGLDFVRRIEMPANNQSVIFRKR